MLTDKRNFKRYLYVLLKGIPTINIRMINGYKYIMNINSKVLNEACLEGRIADKIRKRLCKSNKIKTVSLYNRDFESTNILIEFCNNS